MFQSSLPRKFWPYSILTDTWMINRLPSRVLDWDSPYKILYGTEPDLSVLRPFGCLAFAANTAPSRDKFDSRSTKCIFLGFDAHHKGYLLFDLENSKLLVSRDVKFDPNTYPFSSLNIPISTSSITDKELSFPSLAPTHSVNDGVPSNLFEEPLHTVGDSPSHH